MKPDDELLSSPSGSLDNTPPASGTRKVKLVYRKPETTPGVADILGQVKAETESLLRLMDDHLTDPTPNPQTEENDPVE